MQAASSRWAPALVAAVVTGAFALWNPPLRDLAAHTFRAEYFEQHGFAIWNGTWYGGHYLPAYSVLFPPLAALLSPVWVAAASAVASAHLFDGLVRTRWGERARWAGLWFAALGALRCSRTDGWCSRSAPRSRSARCGRSSLAATASRRRARRGRCAVEPGCGAVPLLVARRRWSSRRAAAPGLAIAVALARSCRWPCSGCCSRRAASSRSGSPPAGRWRCSAGSRCSRSGASEADRDFRAVIAAYLALATLADWLVADSPLGGQHDTARIAVRRPGAARAAACARTAPAADAGRGGRAGGGPGVAGGHAVRGRRPRASATRRPSAPTTSPSRHGSPRAAPSATASRSRTRSATGRRRYVSPDFSLAQRLAAAAGRRAQQPVLRRPRADPPALSAMAPRQRDPVGRRVGRTARLLGRGRGPPGPRSSRPTCACGAGSSIGTCTRWSAHRPGARWGHA